jgi:hypothetical protein
MSCCAARASGSARVQLQQATAACAWVTDGVRERRCQARPAAPRPCRWYYYPPAGFLGVAVWQPAYDARVREILRRKAGRGRRTERPAQRAAPRLPLIRRPAACHRNAFGRLRSYLTTPRLNLSIVADASVLVSGFALSRGKKMVRFFGGGLPRLKRRSRPTR